MLTYLPLISLEGHTLNPRAMLMLSLGKNY